MSAKTELEQIGELSWSGKYWGKLGAIARAKALYTRFFKSTEVKTRVKADAHIALASVLYSASGTAYAYARVCENILVKSFWLFRGVSCLIQAWIHTKRHVQYSRYYPGINPTANELDVAQSVARKFLKLLRPTWLFRQDRVTVRDTASWAIERGLDLDPEPLSKALLLIGKADLQKSDGSVTDLYETVREIWLIALSVSGHLDISIQDQRQLARVYRHLSELSKTLPNDAGDDPSPVSIHELSLAQARKFSASSCDQGLKLEALK